MELSDEDIATFIEIWRETFSETLQPETARLEANRLVDFALTLAESRVDLTGLDLPRRDTMAL